jgi:hypothetical protein
VIATQIPDGKNLRFLSNKNRRKSKNKKRERIDHFEGVGLHKWLKAID